MADRISLRPSIGPRVRSGGRPRAVAFGTAVATCAVTLVAASGASASPADFFQLQWTREFPGTVIGESSPLLVDLNADGTADVVVGTHTGTVLALDGRNGATLWQRNALTATSGINSAASAADVDGDGRPEIFIGSGYADAGTGPGALLSFEHDGTPRAGFPFIADDGLSPSRNPGIHSTPALGDIDQDGNVDVVFGSLGIKSIWAINVNGTVKQGFPYYSNDTNFSTPALADLNGDGVTDFVIGQDQSPPGNRCGTLRGLTGGGLQLFERGMSEIVRSSPAVGDVDGDGQPEIVVGSGNFWSNPANQTAESAATCGSARDDTKIYVLSISGQVERVVETGGNTFPSPSLADTNGDGRLDIVLGTSTQNVPAGSGGELLVVDGASGAQLMRTSAGAAREDIVAGTSAADFDGDGRQDVLIATGSGTYLRQGGTGALLGQVNVGQISSQATPAITDLDNDGRLEVVTAGFRPGASRSAVIQRWTTGSARGAVSASSWPTFHHDARRTGNTNPPPLTQSVCTPGDTTGYWMTARDGGVFTFCGAPFYGSAGAVPLAAPVVAMASTPSGKGYWLVASDGGVFTYGDAQFYGSTGAMRLNQPIVTIVPTRSGQGYLLVARDGGVFTFGDAAFRGSTGAIALNQPIVAGARTASGAGYWLVAADGGVFTFGDAQFQGSTGATRLNKPITTMLTTPGNGYTLVASDGGMFTFGDAAFFGSTGAISLNQPIVAASYTRSGRGYWLFAADGGVFTFGDAQFKGSLGWLRLNAPVVSAAVPWGAS